VDTVIRVLFDVASGIGLASAIVLTRPKRIQHVHCFDLVATTYAAPANMIGMSMANIDKKMIQGCTTLVWKCLDPGCGETKVVTVLGKSEKPIEP
jgi:hypothetical protein